MFKKVYKNIGQTPKQLIDLFESKSGQKYFHTGNLDTMAEGLMILVNTKLRFFESWFKGLSKTYYFHIICGFSTDTHDLLGLLQDIVKWDSPEIQIPQNYTTQVPPKVSYKNLNSKTKLNNFLSGKPLNELPKQKVKIHYLEYLGDYKITKQDLYRKLNTDFAKIKSNYRQKEILDKYNEIKSKLPTHFIVKKYKIKASSGFYVRAFVRDTSILNSMPLTTYSIKRVKIGVFSLVKPNHTNT